MSATVSAASVLIAGDAVPDAGQIAIQLRTYFANVYTSTDESKAAADFEMRAPDVLVLAFNTLEKAERYYLGLFRLSKIAAQSPHRTVVLCNKQELSAAFDLCVKGHFDDYVLYWPQSFDGLRLLMSVWNARRPAQGMSVPGLGTADLLMHAQSLAEVERVTADLQIDSAPEMRKQLEPALAGTRAVASAARAIKPVIMVIDDDEFARRLVKQALDPARWNVLLAANEAEAFSQLRVQVPDVIFMDVHLPGKDGLVLTREIKASPRLSRVPVVMMTGDARRETLADSLMAGAAGFVVKPVTRVALEANLAKIFPR